MPNLPLNEDALVRTLREAETPPARADLLELLQAMPSYRPRPWVWAIPVTAATMLTLALIPILSLPPTLSLGQVAQAFDARTQYTIVNTRLMNKGAESVKVTSYRDGSLWRRGSEFHLRDRSVMIRFLPKYLNYVMLDEPEAPEQHEFRVDRLLRPGVKPVFQKGVMWKGRRVNRFTIHDTYRSTTLQTFDQEVIVDPGTNLPIQMTIMRDSGAWGDVWDYSFATPPASAFVPRIPAGARVYDNRVLRRRLPELLSESQIGGLIVGEANSLLLLTDAAELPAGKVQVSLRLSGAEGQLNGDFSDWPWLSRDPGVMRAEDGIQINGRKWRLARFFLPVPDWPRVNGLRQRKATSGTLTINGKPIRFENVPIVRVGDAMALLRKL
ncbi:MAG: hypothetical protein ACAH95_11150 [Fimbriimonas sp.]